MKTRFGNFVFKSAICWDANRITGILKDLENEVSDCMKYDMSKFLSEDQTEEISYYALPIPVPFKYVLTEDQREYIKRNLAIFGEDPPGVGRLLSNAHTSKLLRSPIRLEPTTGDKVGTC